MSTLETLEKLRADKWSLASDTALIECLKRFQGDLAVKVRVGRARGAARRGGAARSAAHPVAVCVGAQTKRVTDSVAAFCFEAAGTDVTLRTTLNEFLLLSNTQFVENRVYDDDDAPEEPAAPAASERRRRPFGCAFPHRRRRRRPPCPARGLTSALRACVRQSPWRRARSWSG